jgi:hypothetical protein
MNWLRRFMMGRYGTDQLSIALLILSIVSTWIAQLIRLPLLGMIGYIPLGISIFRTLSRNISKRSMENYKFAMFMSPAYSWYRKMMNRAKNAKTRRYVQCPNCRTSLWVPRGKGRIIVTCPKCKTEFKERT